MFIFVFKIAGVEVSAFTWGKDKISGISYAKLLAKAKGYKNYKLDIV